MRPRHPAPPRRWLMTDERIGDSLWAALGRLPRGSGVVFRHHATPAAERRRLFASVARVARRRGLVLVRAGRLRLGRGEAGVHGRGGRIPGAGRGTGKGRGMVTASAHSRRELIAAARAGVGAAFVSPVFATRSHSGARPLGRVRLGLLVRGVRVPVIALGGMTERRFRTLSGLHGWAAIDAWTSDQKRKAVPK